jgi:hypothetical protein
MAALGLETQAGRLLQKEDDANIVFGAQTVQEFFDPKARDPWRYMSQPGEGQKPKVDVLKDKLSLTFDFSYGERKAPNEQETSAKKPKLYKV